jgi:glucose dehydrogenase
MMETVLKPSVVGSRKFQRLFDLQLRDDRDEIYAQPLYVNGLSIPEKGIHNVIFVATQNNWVYAFDADHGDELWSDAPYLPPASADRLNRGAQ